MDDEVAVPRNERKFGMMNKTEFAVAIGIEDFAPVSPRTVSALSRMSKAEQANFAQVAEIISVDPMLAARVISVASRLVRSDDPHQEPVTNVRRAVSMLGLESTYVVMLSCGLLSQLDAGLFAGLNWEGFWRYQITCATAARRLAEITRLAAPGTCFAAALLSNIGVLALCKLQGQPFIDLVNADPGCRGTACWSAEMIAGVTHAQAGAWLLEHWHAPLILSESVAVHPPRAERSDNPVALLCQVAEFVADWVCGVPTAPPAEHVLGPMRKQLAELDVHMLRRDLIEQVDQLSESLVPRQNAEPSLAGAARKLAGAALASIGRRPMRPRVSLARHAELQRTGVASLRDSVTGLYNRRGFVVRARQMTSEVQIGETIAMMVVRLDGLDSLDIVPGPAAVNEIKSLFALRLRDMLGHTHVLGRLRNDHFVAFGRQMDIDSMLDSAAHFCAEIAKQLFATSDGANLTLTLSMGGCWHKVETLPPPPLGMLLRVAEVNLFKATSNGGGQVFFSDM